MLQLVNCCESWNLIIGHASQQIPFSVFSCQANISFPLRKELLFEVLQDVKMQCRR